MPPANDDGSRAAQRESRPNIQIATPAKDTPSLPRATVSARRKRAATRRAAALTCRVSLLAPTGRRTRWWYLATCPACNSPHLGRARELADVTVTRRLPCGHYVAIVVARTYGRSAVAA
jgi:hypothetical protein